MATPITPSLSQILNPPSPLARGGSPAASPQASQQSAGFTSALAAQKAFFQQVTAPKVTPATYTAADIQKAAPAPRPAAAASVTPPQDGAPKRPGSYLNIVV